MVILVGLGIVAGGGASPGAAAMPVGPDAEVLLRPPTDLAIVALDSSLHVTWTPSQDPATAWHVVSVWDGATLQQAKVVGKTSGAAQSNGLIPGHSYTVKVQAMDAQGHLSAPISAPAATDPQSPMRNAAFFENFNEAPGDLDADYFDVRTSHGEGLRPESLDLERMLVFNSENHFHTQLIGGKQRAEIYIRPRVPFDFAGRTGTFEFEVDMAAVQHSPGKWFEIHLVKDLPWSSEEFGAGDGQGFPDSIEFSVRAVDGAESAGSINMPQITVNIGGKVLTYTGTLRQLTPANIRVPVVLKVSATSAEMLINGVSVVRASDFLLPFTRGYWVLAQRGWYASRDTAAAPEVLQLIHWDTIQFDGPAGSYNPIARTYIQPGCAGVVHNEHDGVLDCTKLSFAPDHPTQTLNLNIGDDVSLARSARILYNGSAPDSFTVNVNGHPLTIPTKQCCFFDALNSAEFPAAWLRQGANTLTFGYNGSLSALPDLEQVEVEVVYNEPRTIPVPVDTMPMPMLAVSTASYRVDHLPSDAPVYTATTYLYSFGAGDPVDYTAQVITTDTPWLTVSPAMGTVRSAALGGGMAPLTLAVNFAGLTTDSDGAVGVIKVTGGNMPAYIAILVVADPAASARPTFIPAFTGASTTFNKDAIPDYHGQCAFGDVPANYWAAPAITALACRQVISGDADGTFGPGAAATRGQLARAVVAGRGWSLDAPGGPHFADVPPSDLLYPFIETVAQHGIMSGAADGTFRPSEGVTRGQAAQIVVQAAGWPLAPPGEPHFTDVRPTDPLYPYIETAFQHGLISGYSDGTFRPGAAATRAQIAKIVYAALTQLTR
jgi:hypothetical protein